jgi:hypothetical protein
MGLDHAIRTVEAIRAAPSIPAEPRRWRIWLLSDVALDERPLPVSALPEVDALVVAGGAATGLANAVNLLDRAFGERTFPLLFVPGLREFSDGAPMERAVDEGRRVAEQADVDLLLDDVFRLGEPDGEGLHVVGAPYWPDLSVPGIDPVQVRAHARARWPELQMMTIGRGPLRPHDVMAASARSRSYVEDALLSIWVGAESYGRSPGIVPGIRAGDRAAVVTACPPTRRFQAAPLRDPLSAAWHGPAVEPDLTAPGAPAAWLHGGVPQALDLKLGRTRLVANPCGPSHTGFDPLRVVVV